MSASSKPSKNWTCGNGCKRCRRVWIRAWVPVGMGYPQVKRNCWPSRASFSNILDS